MKKPAFAETARRAKSGRQDYLRWSWGGGPKLIKPSVRFAHCGLFLFLRSRERGARFAEK